MIDVFSGYVLPFTLRWEGGYVDDEDDPGGRTKYGITETTFELAKERGLVFKRRIEELDREDAEAIYRYLFWNRLRCSEMPLWCAVMVFDTGVNQGLFWAGYHLQRSLNGIHRYRTGRFFVYNLREDGIIGAKTLGALRDFELRAPEQTKDEFIRLYCVNRDLRYLEIIINNPRLQKFAKGWFMRTSDLQDYAQSLKEVRHGR